MLFILWFFLLSKKPGLIKLSDGLKNFGSFCQIFHSKWKKAFFEKRFQKGNVRSTFFRVNKYRDCCGSLNQQLAEETIHHHSPRCGDTASEKISKRDKETCSNPERCRSIKKKLRSGKYPIGSSPLEIIPHKSQKQSKN